MILEFAIIIALALLNGLFAMAELALVSSNKSKLTMLAQNGDKGAKRALSLANSPAVYMATIQFGITLIGIVAGVFGGAALAEDFAEFLSQWQSLKELAMPLSYVMVVGTITYLSIVLGEVVPKQYALSYPEEIAKSLSGFLLIIRKVFTPIVWFLEHSSAFITKILPIKLESHKEIKEEDIRAMVAHGAAVGEIESTEKEMVYRVFRLDDRPIRAFMTPRKDIIWLDLERPLEAIWKTAINVPHSFFPAAEGSLDLGMGFISITDLSIVYNSQGAKELREYIRPALRVSAKSDALTVLELFKRERKHMALVIDDHNSVDGVVTTHDLLEAIVGDMGDFEGQEQEIIHRDDGSLLIDAALDIQELFLALGLEIPAHQVSDEYHSAGGFIVNKLARMPKEGDLVLSDGFKFEVVDMDRHRIDKILVSKLPALEEK